MLQERDAANAKAYKEVESYKKTGDFACTVENHCKAKPAKIYGKLVTQIRQIQAEYLVENVKGLHAFLRYQKRET